MNEIRLICCDIDGTLVRDDKSLSKENIYWIRKARNERNVRFVITTGRMASATRRYHEKLGFMDFQSCVNGALLYGERGEILADHRIPPDIARIIWEEGRRAGVEMLGVSRNEWYTASHSGYLYSMKRPIYAKESHVVDFASLPDSLTFNKFLFMSEDEGKVKALQEALRSSLVNEDDITYYPGRGFLELMARGISKVTGIDDLASFLGLERDEILALGDDLNDIGMLRRCGVSVAMGNALAEVKNAARYVTRTNEEDGVAYAIEKLIFSGERK